VPLTMTKTTAGLNLLRDGNYGAANPKLFYIALGTGSSTPLAGNTKLDNEVFRKAITTYSTAGGTGDIVAQIYIEPTEAVGYTIAEVGIFGGSSASATANSGVLLARGLYSPTHPKTSTESMVIPVDITYS
jgi:hypothetical protein